MTSGSTGFPPVIELIPHRPPMILIDSLLEWSPASARVRAVVRAGNPFCVVDGSREQVPATALLEYMAQAIAAANGMTNRVRGRPPGEVGLLLGTREFELHVDALAIGDESSLRVIHEFSDDSLARYECSATRASEPGELLARATINVMHGSAAGIRG